MSHTWIVSIDGEELLPMDSAKLARFANKGRIPPHALVRRGDLVSAVRADAMAGLLAGAVTRAEVEAWKPAGEAAPAAAEPEAGADASAARAVASDAAADEDADAGPAADATSDKDADAEADPYAPPRARGRARAGSAARGAGARRRPFRSLRGLGLATVICLGLCGAVSLVVLLANLQQVELLERMDAGDDWTDAEVEQGDLFMGLALGGSAASSLLTIVVYLFWVYRASSNQVALGGRPQWSPGWSVGGWFIPFANLYIPYACVAEIWRTSLGRDRSIVLVLCWWLTWLVSGILDNIWARLEGEEISELISESYLGAVGGFVSLVAAVLALLVVWKITQGQEELHEQIESGEVSVEPILTRGRRGAAGARRAGRRR